MIKKCECDGVMVDIEFDPCFENIPDCRFACPCHEILVDGIQTTRIIRCENIILQDAVVPTDITLELKASENIIINESIVESDGILELKASEKVIIGSGFRVEAGATFKINKIGN